MRIWCWLDLVPENSADLSAVRAYGLIAPNKNPNKNLGWAAAAGCECFPEHRTESYHSFYGGDPKLKLIVGHRVEARCFTVGPLFESGAHLELEHLWTAVPTCSNFDRYARLGRRIAATSASRQ